jgi:hypothetical protein
MKYIYSNMGKINGLEIQLPLLVEQGAWLALVTTIA